MKKLVIFFVQAMAVNLFLIQGAYAYFDYGTGSLLIQSFVAFLGMIAMFFSRIKEVTRAFFSKLLQKKRSKPEQPVEEEN